MSKQSRGLPVERFLAFLLFEGKKSRCCDNGDICENNFIVVGVCVQKLECYNMLALATAATVVVKYWLVHG